MGRFGSWCAVALLVSLLGLATACAGEGPERQAEADKANSAAGESRADDGVSLYLAGDGELTVVDVDAGTSRVLSVPELAPGDPPYRIVRAGDKLVVHGPDAAYTAGLDTPSEPRRLAEAWFFIPSADPDRVWVALLDPESPDTVRALSGVREITVDGRVTVPDVAPPRGAWPLSAAGRALVFEAADGLEVWDYVTGKVDMVLAGRTPGPGRDSLLPWCGDDYGRLHVTDVRTGDEVVVAPPDGFVAFDCGSAAFAPGGNLLAVPIAVGKGYEAARALALVDLDLGAAKVVAGSKVESGYVFVAWSSSGKSVFMSGGQDPADRTLVEYELGADRAVELSVRVERFYGMAAS